MAVAGLVLAVGQVPVPVPVGVGEGEAVADTGVCL